MSFTIQDILPTNNKPIKNKVELIKIYHIIKEYAIL